MGLGSPPADGDVVAGEGGVVAGAVVVAEGALLAAVVVAVLSSVSLGGTGPTIAFSTWEFGIATMLPPLCSRT